MLIQEYLLLLQIILPFSHFIHLMISILIILVLWFLLLIFQVLGLFLLIKL